MAREKKIFRGYDTSELFRKDTLIRLRRLAAEIRAGIQKIKNLEREAGEEDDDPDCE